MSKVTPEMTFKEVTEKYPITRDFFAHYGVLKYVKKKRLLNEPLSSFAKTSSADSGNLIEELNKFLEINVNSKPRENPIKAFQAVWFAMVMSTGIVSMASLRVANLYHMKVFSDTLIGFAQALFWINVATYPVMIIMQLSRCAAFPKAVIADLSNPKTCLVFFTIVAGTNVLGSQIAIFGYLEVAKIFWYWGLFLWVLITISTFSFLFIKGISPIEESINGGWLLATVGTQSVAVLGSIIAPDYPKYGYFIFFLAYIWWLVGCFLYIVIMTLIMYRLIFFKLGPKELVPPYWINMGAVAITTLAGALLVLNGMKLQRGFVELLSFTRGFTFFFWAFGTWWIPLLVVLGFWKYVFHKTKPAFNPAYWGMVFPLGMYTACTYQLAYAMDLYFLLNIPKYFWFFAITAWVLTFIWTWAFIVKPRKKLLYPVASNKAFLTFKRGQ
ncbi:MAG TPA: tellurite resistance/C4-dicarboxylate transporter family protein [Candidatus Hypogeohydataceae bacterium YC40]